MHVLENRLTKILENDIPYPPPPKKNKMLRLLQSWKNGFQMRIEELFCYLAYTVYIYAVFQCATFMICLCIFYEQ